MGDQTRKCGGYARRCRVDADIAQYAGGRNEWTNDVATVSIS